MPDRHSVRLTDLAEVSRAIVEALAASQWPPPDQIDRFNGLVDSLRPAYSADPFFVPWCIFDAATTQLAIAMSNVHSGAGEAQRATLRSLRRGIHDLDSMLKAG